MDEEANCGLGLNVYQYCSEPLNKQNIHKAIERIEAQQSIKFRKIMFLTDEEIYNDLEDELIEDEIKIYHSSGNDSCIEYIKRNEPDIILVDLYNAKFNAIQTLTKINDDLFAKSIPIIAFVNSTDEEKNKILYNNLIRNNTTLSISSVRYLENN